jgi:hypothetical protein
MLIMEKGREVFSSLFGFRGDLTLTRYLPKKYTTVILLLSQRHNKSCMGENQAFKMAR